MVSYGQPTTTQEFSAEWWSPFTLGKHFSKPFILWTFGPLMTSGWQLSEALEHKLPKSLYEEINPQLINTYTKNMSPQHGFSEKWSSVLVFLPKNV